MWRCDAGVGAGTGLAVSLAGTRAQETFLLRRFHDNRFVRSPNQHLVRLTATAMRPLEKRRPEPPPCETREEALLRRARRHRRRGEHRKAMLALREAAYVGDSCPRLWTLYGMSCVRAGKASDAAQALRQALWLRERRKDDARAAVTQGLLDRLNDGDLQAA